MNLKNKIFPALAALVATVGISHAALPYHFEAHERVVPAHSWWMDVDGTINANGDVTVFTKTTTREALMGFHGTALLVYKDAPGNIIAVQKIASYGVDGEYVPFGAPSSRKDSWTGHLSLEVADKVASVQVLCMQNGPHSERVYRELLTQVVALINS